MGTNYIKIVECKTCNKKFEITYDNTQSGFSSCNKKYCSSECKEKSKKVNTQNRIELSCQECKSTYYLPPSLSKNSKYCSRKCQNLYQTKLNTGVREIRKCLKCYRDYQVITTSKRKYCTPECAGISRRTEKIVQKCEMCQIEFKKYKNSPIRFCGRKCQYAAQSAGLIKISTHGRSGKRSDLCDEYFRSSLEADYARYCRHLNIAYQYEPKTFHVNMGDEIVRYYTPDFYHPDTDQFVELKAGRPDGAYEDNLLALNKLKQTGLKIDVLYMKEFYDKLKKEGLYDVIPNLERRNYKQTKHLVT